MSAAIEIYNSNEIHHFYTYRKCGTYHQAFANNNSDYSRNHE